MPSAKSTLSTRWWVRVDGDADVLRPKVKAFAERIDCLSMICCHHMGSRKENPHVHMAIEMLNEVQKQTFALTVKKHFGVVDRSYALDVWDGLRNQGAPTYLFHEMGDVFVSKGWTPDDIAQAQRLGYQIAAEVEKSKEKASQKLVERALVHFESRQPSKFDILEFMIREIHQRTAYHPGQFKLKQYVEEVEIKLTPADGILRLTHEYFNSMWRV